MSGRVNEGFCFVARKLANEDAESLSPVVAIPAQNATSPRRELPIYGSNASPGFDVAPASFHGDNGEQIRSDGVLLETELKQLCLMSI